MHCFKICYTASYAVKITHVVKDVHSIDSVGNFCRNKKERKNPEQARVGMFPLNVNGDSEQKYIKSINLKLFHLRNIQHSILISKKKKKIQDLLTSPTICSFGVRCKNILF